MPDATFISPERPANSGLDFESLREQGLETLQRLAGEVWTDFNEHDPGVTILEQLCYALTELSYRADLPIEDVLADPATGRLDPARTALFRPDVMLATAPVTGRDARRLLIDRVPGVANAWFSPLQQDSVDAIQGLQEVELYVPQDDPVSWAAARRAAVRRARRVCSRYRALCEDVVGIHVLAPVPATLSATITIDRSAAAEAVLARVFYQIGLFLAPEVRRESLEQRLAGSSLAEVFAGPLPTNGFIADGQLQPRVTEVTLAELTRQLGLVEGLAIVQHVELRTPLGTIGARRDSTLAVGGRRVLRLDANDVNGVFEVTMIQDGAPCRPHPAAVRRELHRLWADHRRRYDVRAERAGLFAAPNGTPIDLGEYHSIQHQFPNVYGINGYGLPAEADADRRAQARQLKGYLLLFEQILADAFTRLASARDLFSSAATPRVRAAAFLDTSVPDAAPLLTPSYRTRLPAVAHHADRALDRRNRALDLMLAIYGESIGQPVLSPGASDAAGEALIRAQIRAKRALLRRLPWLAGRRGCGVDYLGGPRDRARVAVEVRSRIQLGMDAEPRPLAGLLEAEQITLIGTGPNSDRVDMIRYAPHIDAEFEAVPHVPASQQTLHHRPRTISEDLLLAAADQAQYRIGRLPGDDSITVVCRAPAQPVWQLVGRYNDRGAALLEVARLLDTVGRIERRVRRLAIVEHVLLRSGRSQDSRLVSSRGFEYGYTATAVVALPAREASDAPYRAGVEDVLRANTPAHIVLDVLFLRLGDAVAFERLHDGWLESLRHGRSLERMEACRRMRTFLQSGRQQ